MEAPLSARDTCVSKNILYTTHPRCHNSLWGKEMVTSAKVQHQWSRCQGHRILWSSEHCNCHSSRVHSRSGSQVLQGECRVGQEWEGLGRGRLNLLIRFDIWQQQSESYLDQSMTKSNISQEQASRSSAEISLKTSKRAFAPLYQSSWILLETTLKLYFQGIFTYNKVIEHWGISKHYADTHLLLLQSNSHSTQCLYHCHQYWSEAWSCCLCLWGRLGGRSRSSSPSRLFRHRQWLSGGRCKNQSSGYGYKKQKIWRREWVLVPLLSSPFAPGY